jgi:hypothetical protein
MLCLRYHPVRRHRGIAGGLIGFNAQNAYVKNSTTSVTVTGGGNVGGLIGQNSGGPVDNCHVSGSVATSLAITLPRVAW